MYELSLNENLKFNLVDLFVYIYYVGLQLITYLN